MVTMIDEFASPRAGGSDASQVRCRGAAAAATSSNTMAPPRRAARISGVLASIRVDDRMTTVASVVATQVSSETHPMTKMRVVLAASTAHRQAR